MTLDLPAVLQRRSDALQMLSQALADTPGVLLASAEQWAKRKDDHRPLFAMLLSLIRDLSISRAGGHEAQLMHLDIWDTLSALAASIPTAILWEIFEIVHSTQEAIAHNVNAQLAFEVMFFKIGDVYDRARRRDRQRQRYASV